VLVQSLVSGLGFAAAEGWPVLGRRTVMSKDYLAKRDWRFAQPVGCECFPGAGGAHKPPSTFFGHEAK
jgi:hypothetical protein